MKRGKDRAVSFPLDYHVDTSVLYTLQFHQIVFLISCASNDLFNKFLLVIILYFLQSHRAHFKRQSKQGDKSACIVMIIHISGREGSK